jgi:hypothetical protein
MAGVHRLADVLIRSLAHLTSQQHHNPTAQQHNNTAPQQHDYTREPHSDKDAAPRQPLLGNGYGYSANHYPATTLRDH